MSWVVRAATSSIGQKVLMAVTGLALTAFTVIHLLGNLLLYVGAEEYNRYAKLLHSEPILLLIAELGLFAMFAIHIVLAFRTWRQNRKARGGNEYAMKQSKLHHSPVAAPPSRVMGLTGVIVLAFLAVHLSDFKFELRNAGSEGELPFDKAVRLLQDPITMSTYVLGSVVLGYHLLHGFASAFQTLGLSHPKYAAFIKWLSLLLAIAIGAGFASFPVWATALRVAAP